MPERTRHLVASLVAAVLGCTGVATAYATVVLGLDKQALVRESDGIVAGVVSSIEYVPGAEDLPEILTRIRIDVLQTYKALPGAENTDQVVLTQTGGTLAGKTLHVHGHATYRKGEQVLVFLERLDDGRVMTFGMAQGKFTLVDAGGTTVAVRDLGDLTLATRGADGRMVLRTDLVRFPVRFDLGELERMIAALNNPLRPVGDDTDPVDVR